MGKCCSYASRRAMGFFHYVVNERPLFTALDLILILIPCIIIFRLSRSQKKQQPVATSLDALSTDPGLLKKHSTYAWYHVPATGFTYPSLRIFYRPHPQRDKLPSHPRAIPLLVFIHGLGGSIAQFHPLLNSLVNCADSLAPDLPGCGLSSFDPKDWDAYTADSLVHLLAVIIHKHRDVEHDQKVVLICHSMGCSLGAYLASSSSPHTSLLAEHVSGVVCMCPTAEPPTNKVFRRLLSIPVPIFDLWRLFDSRGGIESQSVFRLTGKDADLDTRKLQLRFNKQSRSAVWMRMSAGCLPDYSSGSPVGGVAGKEVWAGVKVPLYLIAGEADTITPVANVTKIAKFVGRDIAPSNLTTTSTASFSPSAKRISDSTSTSSESLVASSDPPSILKITVFPKPASHALLYSTRTFRPLSASIQTFLSASIDLRLSQGWQLQRLTTEGKWDVKNLAKWRAVTPVSAPIADVFRAIKTLREADEEEGGHAPHVLARDWGPGSMDGKDGLGVIAAVIDISHEAPVYDPLGLERAGVGYRKFPTVSKLPPTRDEVSEFLGLVDGLRKEFGNDASEPVPHALIAVHCHYGYNRTGFFIVCYLVERLAWRLKDAIEEFKVKRPPGIRHSHFIDELWGRYWTRDGKRE